MRPEAPCLETATAARASARRAQAVLAVLALLLLAAAWQGVWLSLLGLPLLLWLATSLRAAPTSPAPQQALAPLRNEGLPLMLAHILPVWGAQVEQVDQELQTGTAELLDSFGQIMSLSSQLAPLPSEPAAAAALAHELGAHAERALQALQFSDRVTQMLAVIRQDIDRLNQAHPTLTKATAGTAEQWLKDLEARYTTDEQRARHQTLASPPRQNSVDFF